MSVEWAAGRRRLTAEQHNRKMLVSMATSIAQLRERVVFVGSTVLPLLITDPYVLQVRYAKDVDALFDWTDKRDLFAFEDIMWDLGFEKHLSGATTRWWLDGVTLDVLSTNPATVGSNAVWFGEAWQSASVVQLDDDMSIKVLSAPALLAAKFSAFAGRGRGDYFNSADIADILLLCAGRSTVTAELASYPAAKLKRFVKAQLPALLAAFARDHHAIRQGRFLQHIEPAVITRALERMAKVL